MGLRRLTWDLVSVFGLRGASVRPGPTMSLLETEVRAARHEGREMSTATADQAHVTNEPELRRVMRRKLLLLFIVGDILGAGVYAVTGQMAGIVGGIVWVPFVIAFLVALTAMSYLELITKYPQAAGAALYTHKAFGIHFATFLVAFAAVCSSITSASTSSTVLAQNLTGGLVVNGWLDEAPAPASSS